MTANMNSNRLRLTPAKRNILAHMKYQDAKVSIATAPGVNMAWLPDYPGIVRIESIQNLISVGFLVLISNGSGIATYGLSPTASNRV